MSSFTTALVTKRTDLVTARGLPMLQVQQPFVWEIGYKGSGNCVVIPAGFLTDGPSVPRCLQWAMPMDHLEKPSVLHDWLLSQLEWEKARADFEFNLAMKACGVRQPYRLVAYLAVQHNRTPRTPPRMEALI